MGRFSRIPKAQTTGRQTANSPVAGVPPTGVAPNSDVLCPRFGRGESDGDELVAPISQSTTYCRSTVGSDPPHQYSRVSNRTVHVLESALGALEEAPPGLCFATGLAAESALFLAVLKAGDHLVCGRSVYGGTTRLLEKLLSDWKIETTFVDATDLDAVAAAVRTNTRLLFVETPSNPTLELTDIRGCARIAHDAGALLGVDNTFLTAVLQRPLDLGADVSVYSTTKFIDGHSLALGGALVSKDEVLLDRIRFVRKCIGSIQSPFNAWLTINGLKTLPLRIRKQSETAQEVAAWLAHQPQVRSVYYPDSNSVNEVLLTNQHLGAHGAVLSFEIAGGIHAARRFAERLELACLVEHVGSVETLITHPATMTHADVDPEQRNRVGIGDGLLRLSVGLEPAEAIIRDLEQGFVGVGESLEEVTSC